MLESTTYPGTTEELVLPILEEGGMRCPVNREGRYADFPQIFIWLFRRSAKIPEQAVRIGADSQSRGGKRLPRADAPRSALYAQIVSKVVPVSCTQAAEMVKLLENIFRCVNIALVNELKQLCLRMGLDVWEIIDGAATKPFGFMPFYPGPVWAGIAFPSTPIIFPGKLANTTSPRDLSS